jgi:hypothetical protein
MPTALFFIPCERPLLDAMTNQLTLFAVLGSVQPAPFQPEGDVPSQLSDARFILPPFFLVANWSKNESDEGIWEQHVTITAPDKKETRITPDVSFAFDTPLHMVFQRTNFITGRLVGFSTLNLKMRRVGSEEWQTVATYPLHIEEFPELPEAPPSTPTLQEVSD